MNEPPPAASAWLDGGAALWQEPGRGWPCCTGLSCPLWCLVQRDRDLERCKLEAYQEQAAPGYDDVPSVGTLGALLAASMRRCGRIGCLCRCDSQKIYEGGIVITQRPTEVLKSEKRCLLVK